MLKSLETMPKNAAEQMYVRYVKEIYVMYAQSSYNDIIVGKYLYNGSSFKDLNYLLRTMFYNEYRNNANYFVTY